MIAFLLGYAVIALIWAAARSSERKLALDRVARSRGGELRESWLSPAGVTFRVDGVPAELEVGGEGWGGGRTSVRFRAPAKGHLRIRRRGAFSALFGLDGLGTGDDPFDRAWVVEGGPSSWVRGTLGAAARARIETLAARGSLLFRSGGFELTADAHGVAFSIDRNLAGNEDELRGFLHDAETLFRRLRETGEEGITWETVSELPAGARCPLCEHPLAGELRRCATCRTPHHAECWDWNGSCTTYACGGRNSLRAPAPAAPASRGGGSFRAAGRGAA